MENRDLIKKAKKRVKAKKEFYSHLVSYVSVSIFLFFINYFTSPAYWWFVFPVGGWGIGVVAHYFSVFGFMGINSSDWEQQEMAKEMDRLRQKENEELLLDDQLVLKEKIKLDKEWNEEDFV